MRDQRDEAFRELARRIEPDATFLRSWPLGGGVSAEVTVIELERRGRELGRFLVRRHGTVDRTRNPHIARDEFTLLRIAHAHGLAVPRPLYLDESDELFPTPVLVIEYIEGETDLSPADLTSYLAQAAAHLAGIHSLPASPELALLPRQDRGFGPRPVVLDASLDEGRVRDVLEAAWPAPKTNPSVLLHGDYWPGNLLWRDGTLAAVIDWEDARLGDPLGDLANSRLEFLWAFGPAAMAEFSRRYLATAAIDAGNLPYWDLAAALRPCGKLGTWGLDAAAAERMRQHHAWFVAQALNRLAGR